MLRRMRSLRAAFQKKFSPASSIVVGVNELTFWGILVVFQNESRGLGIQLLNFAAVRVPG
jgi:hypothetical protein